MDLWEHDLIDRKATSWLFISLVAAGTAGFLAYDNAQKFASVVDLLATIISILVGVSLAVIAVLTSPFSVSDQKAKDEYEAVRMTNTIKEDDEIIAKGQLIFFWVFFLALGLSLIFSWAIAGADTDFEDQYIKWLSCLTASVSIFAFMWSARLPSLLQKISSQRRTLG